MSGVTMNPGASPAVAMVAGQTTPGLASAAGQPAAARHYGKRSDFEDSIIAHQQAINTGRAAKSRRPGGKDVPSGKPADKTGGVRRKREATRLPHDASIAAMLQHTLPPPQDLHGARADEKPPEKTGDVVRGDGNTHSRKPQTQSAALPVRPGNKNAGNDSMAELSGYATGFTAGRSGAIPPSTVAGKALDALHYKPDSQPAGGQPLVADRVRTTGRRPSIPGKEAGSPQGALSSLSADPGRQTAESRRESVDSAGVRAPGDRVLHAIGAVAAMADGVSPEPLRPLAGLRGQRTAATKKAPSEADARVPSSLSLGPMIGSLPAVPTPQSAGAPASGTSAANHPDFSNALGQHMVVMLSTGQHDALLHLSPPHLGTVQVHLSTNQQSVNALFVSAQPDVRQALEASMPSLRQALAQHGLSLAGGFVADHGNRGFSGRYARSRQLNPARMPGGPSALAGVLLETAGAARYISRGVSIYV